MPYVPRMANTTAPVAPKFLSTAQAASRLGVDVRTIHRWASKGRLTPAIKADGLRGPLFFLEADVIALEESA